MIRVCISAVMLIAALLFASFGAQAQSVRTGSVVGTASDQVTNLPIANVAVTLYLDATKIADTQSDAAGAFRFADVMPGIYTVVLTSSEFDTVRSRPFAVTTGGAASVPIALGRAALHDETNLKTLASVSASTTNAIASTTTDTRTIDPGLLANENYFRIGDALRTLPGVNFTGLSSSVSDDLYLNIRGEGESETQTLLDGHPIGPQGVYGINTSGGTYQAGYNYSDSPYFGLSKVQVTYGSGASGLYGVDAIGGTVDLQTLNPTPVTHYDAFYGIGDESRTLAAVRTTGTAGKLGYAVAGSIQGTDGLFAPQSIAQTGRPNNDLNLNNNGNCTAGNDVSACNLALNTYGVSANSVVRSVLGKLTYAVSPNTTAGASVLSSGQWSDSTGNGDNDDIPFDTRKAQILANAGDCALPTDTGAAKNGYTVITNDTPMQTACYTAGQWAGVSSGPYGGGAGRSRGVDDSDLNFRVASVSGKNTLVADGYYNYYKFWKTSEEASGLDASGTLFTGTAYSQFFNTQGYLVSDDFANADSDIGIGYFGEYQAASRLEYNDVGLGQFSYDMPESTHYNSGFVRASLDVTPKLSAFGNLWVKSSSVIGDTNIDPRISFTYKPESSDVFRATFGRTTGDPAAELKEAGSPQITANPSSLNPSCTPFNVIGSAGNPGIEAEKSTDIEVGYAHRFGFDSQIGVNLYDTSVDNQLFSANEPLTQYGTLPIPALLLTGFAAKIASAGCPGVSASNPSSVIPYLSVATTYNASSAQYRGIELNSHFRLNRRIFIEFSYDVQQAVQNGINSDILANNLNIVNGGQILGIPLNQGTAGIDYANVLGGLEARMDAYVVGTNNPSSRPGYNLWNGFVAKSFRGGLKLNFGISNIFDEASQNYGYFGHQAFAPENSFGTDTNSIAQFINTGSGEEFGLPPRSFTFSLSQHV